jgi:hypothetical protein
MAVNLVNLSHLPRLPVPGIRAFAGLHVTHHNSTATGNAHQGLSVQ